MSSTTHKSIKKFYLIYQKISSSLGYPGAREILDHLAAYDVPMARRTFQRHLGAFRDEFGVEITYDEYRQGYFIDKANSRQDITHFFNYLSLMYQSGVFFENINDSRNTLKYVDFEFDGLLTGIEYLDPLMKAIKNNQVVRITYLKHHYPEPRQYLLHPALLKSYQGRWYIIGYEENAGDYRIFGIDRIQNLEKRSQHFDAGEKDNVHSLFNHLTGLNFSESHAQDVVLQISPEQAGYVKSLPFHASQEIIEENKKGLKIRLFIVPNFEFKQKIWMLGTRVKVLKPEWLASQIKEELKHALAQYEDF